MYMYNYDNAVMTDNISIIVAMHLIQLTCVYQSWCYVSLLFSSHLPLSEVFS